MHWETVGIIGSFLALLWGIWKIARDFREDLQKTTTLLFKRFDDHKKDVDAKLLLISETHDRKFVNQQICDLTRTTFSKVVEDLKASFEKKIDNIERKLDLLLEERRKSE